MVLASQIQWRPGVSTTEPGGDAAEDPAEDPTEDPCGEPDKVVLPFVNRAARRAGSRQTAARRGRRLGSSIWAAIGLDSLLGQADTPGEIHTFGAVPAAVVRRMAQGRVILRRLVIDDAGRLLDAELTLPLTAGSAVDADLRELMLTTALPPTPARLRRQRLPAAGRPRPSRRAARPHLYRRRLRAPGPALRRRTRDPLAPRLHQRSQLRRHVPLASPTQDPRWLDHPPTPRRLGALDQSGWTHPPTSTLRLHPLHQLNTRRSCRAQHELATVSRATRPRRTSSTIASTLAVQTNSLGSSLLACKEALDRDDLIRRAVEDPAA